MFTAKKVYAMLENESLWEAATQCHQILAAAKIPHAVMGGVAVCLHGYQRNRPMWICWFARKTPPRFGKTWSERILLLLGRNGERRGVSPTWQRQNTSGLRLDAGFRHRDPILACGG